MTPAEARIEFLKRLNQIAGRLPNGLLQRLVEDASFFAEWHQGKRRSRGYGRMQQQRRLEEQAEERYWREVKRRAGG